MAKQVISNVKLGAFVLAGLFFLILLLYLIGKNENMFGSNFILKARFENVQGLKAGHNIRYAGINVGTVKQVNFLSDTLVEVVMLIDDKMKSIIRKNAFVSIGTDGLVGNKVVNIAGSKNAAAAASEGDILPSKKPVDTDEMLRTLYTTNNNIAVIAENLKTTLSQINNSDALWQVLNDSDLPQNLKRSVYNIRKATAKANDMANDLHSIVADVKNGEGSLGAMLKDTAFSYNLNAAITKIKLVGDEADSLTNQISRVVSGIQQDINSGDGAVHSLLKDSTMVIKLNNSLSNIEKGTEGFNQNMEALKHHFLFKGYFKKQEKLNKENEQKVE